MTLSAEDTKEQDEVIDALAVKDEAPAPEAEKPAPSLRDSLASALEQTKAKAAPEQTETPKQKADRERDESGKFVKKAEDKPTVPRGTNKTQIKEQPITQELAPIVMPKSFPAAHAKDFAALPRPLQELLAKREEDFHKELTKHDEERQFGRTVRDLANPYVPLIKAEGGDIAKAFGSYLNTAYILRTKSPQEKGQLLLKLASEFGADLRGASQAQGQAHPVIHQLEQKIAQLEGRLTQDSELKKQQEESALKSQIDTFAADPSHPHFEAVKAHMAALLRGNAAKDLQDAYDQAVYANPQTRSTLLQQQQTDAAEEKRLAQKAKAEAAKKAGSSIKGGPGMGASKNPTIQQPNLRAALKSAFAEHRGEA